MIRFSARKLGILLLLASCGGKLTVDRDAPGAGSNDGGSSQVGGTAGRAGDDNHGGSTFDAGSSSVAGTSLNEGASANNGGTGAVGGDATGGNVSMTGGNGGTTGVGEAGGDGLAGASGACQDVSDPPGDCQRVDCDAADHAARVVDQSDLPKPENPCLAGTCNAAGKPGTALRNARYSCEDGMGDVMCDGKGACVECTKSTDCGAKQYCSKAGKCGAEPCTDVDCGGACPFCANGKKCLVNDDCQSYACDYDTHTCIAEPCKDHHQDGNETDADCGGGVCPGCALTQGCNLDLDCAGYACDVDTLSCISNQCADHRQDGDETDKDCGGGTCAGCPLYKKCHTNFDCADGLCSVTTPHLCTP